MGVKRLHEFLKKYNISDDHDTINRIIEHYGEPNKDEMMYKIGKGSLDLQELTKTYDDYSYYPKLKDYFAAVSSYVEFFKSPSGSFKQLSDTVNNYETNIRTYQSDVGFLFNK